jgi:hypothetical protein
MCKGNSYNNITPNGNRATVLRILDCLGSSLGPEIGYLD